MKRLIGLLLLAGLIYGGYWYYTQSLAPKNLTASQLTASPTLTVASQSSKLNELASVLGASISTTYESGKELLSSATGGGSEPIINELVTRTADALKDLPRKEAEKIKYEFCKGVVKEYEQKQ